MDLNNTNVTNISELEIKVEGDIYSMQHDYPKSLTIPLAFLMLIFMTVAIVGNVMVVMTIWRHNGMRTRTNMFIVNLAVADISVAVLDMPFSLVTILKGRWIFGWAMCQLNAFTMALFLICSIHTLMYISIHKYISITKPFSRAMTPQRIKMMIAATWIWAAICAVGPMIGWNKNTYKLGASQCGPDIPKEIIAKTHSLFITTSNYIIPLGVMFFCYFRIFREIHEHMTRIRETSSINLESSVQQQKKVSVTLFLVLACFLLCWTPFVLYSTAVSFMKNKKNMPLEINPLAYWFGYLNSACNPVIYAFRSPSFRQGYKEIICGKSAIIHSGVHSLSFRSKSLRGSTKNNSLKRQESRDVQRVRPVRMLSQTSWMSLPIIPYRMRSASAGKKEQLQRQQSTFEFDDEPIISYCCFECSRKYDVSESTYSRNQSSHSLQRQKSSDSQRVCDTLEEQPEPAISIEDNLDQIDAELEELTDIKLEENITILNNDSSINGTLDERPDSGQIVTSEVEVQIVNRESPAEDYL